MATFPAGMDNLQQHPFCGPFQSSAGDYYAFFGDSSTVETLMAIKASDPTGAWTELDAANAPTGDGDPSSIRQIWGRQVGDDIHMSFVDGGSEIFYARFEMATDSWADLDGGGDRETQLLFAQPAIAGGPFHSALDVKDDGEIIAILTTSDLVMSIERPRVHYSTSTDAGDTFTNQGDATGRSASEQAPHNSGMILTTPAGRSHIFFHLTTGADLKCSTLLDDGTFGVQDALVDTSTIITTTNAMVGRPVLFDDGGTIRCRACYVNGTRLAVTSWDDADVPTFSLSGSISDFVINRFNLAGQLHMVNDGARLWYVYTQGTAPDDRIRYDEDPVGDGSWTGSEVELADTDSDITMFSCNLIERGGQLRIGCFAHDFGPDVVDYFESVDLGVAPGGGGGGGSPDGTRSPLCNSLFGRSKLQSFRCE